MTSGTFPGRSQITSTDKNGCCRQDVSGRHDTGLTGSFARLAGADAAGSGHLQPVVKACALPLVTCGARRLHKIDYCIRVTVYKNLPYLLYIA